MFKKIKSKIKAAFNPPKIDTTGTNRYKVICQITLPFDEGNHIITLTRFTKVTKDKITASKNISKQFEYALKHASVAVFDIKETIQHK